MKRTTCSCSTPSASDDRTRSLRELPGQAAQHRRVPVADVVVDGDPAVARRRDDAAVRAARQPRHELADGALDRADVVGLDVDRAERAAAADACAPRAAARDCATPRGSRAGRRTAAPPGSRSGCRCVAPRARTFSITASTSARPTPSRRLALGDVDVPDPGDVAPRARRRRSRPPRRPPRRGRARWHRGRVRTRTGSHPSSCRPRAAGPGSRTARGPRAAERRSRSIVCAVADRHAGGNTRSPVRR